MCLCMSVCVCLFLYLKRVLGYQIENGISFVNAGGRVKTFVTYQEVVDFRCDQYITRKILTKVTVTVTDTVTIAVFMYFSFVYCLNVFDVHYVYVFVFVFV